MRQSSYSCRCKPVTNFSKINFTSDKFYWFRSLFHKNYETSFFEKIYFVFERKICETAMGTNLPITCSEKGKCGSNGGFRTPVGVAFTDKGLFAFLCQLERYDPVYLVNCEKILFLDFFHLDSIPLEAGADYVRHRNGP